MLCSFPNMLKFVPVWAILSFSLVEAIAMPQETGFSRLEMMKYKKRQSDSDPYDGPAPEVANGDPEPYADTDYLRDIVSYRKNYFNDNGALTSMKVGAKPSDATMTIFTTIKPGSNIPAPADPSQGSQFEVDHLMELQNFHGAFSVAQKPANIPQSDWDAARSAVFSKTPNPPMTSLARIISGPPNMEAIPAAINNFKGQVFRGVINNGKNGPTNTRYPTEFGPTVNKLLADRKPSYDEVLENLAEQLKSAANNNADVSSYFSSYASSVYSSATSFLSQWTGKNGVYASTSSSSSGTETKAHQTSVSAKQTPSPVKVSKASTSTSAAAAKGTCKSKCNCNEDSCTADSPDCCPNGTCDASC